MQYYIFTNILLSAFLLSYLWFFYDLTKDNRSKLIYVFCYSVIIALLFKYPFSNHFLGLEYEDAYVFNFSARQLANNIYPISFLTDGINIGSLNNPISTVTYSGHLITYPTFLSWFYRIFGYHMYLPSYINFVIEFSIILTLSVFFKFALKFDKTWFIPAIIYSIAPIINVFGNSHLSETFSSFTILLSIICFYYYAISKKTHLLIPFCVFFLTTLLTKRENIALFGFIFIFSTFNYIINKDKHRNNFYPLALSLLSIILYFFLVKNYLDVEQTDALEISAPTFSLQYFCGLLPQFLKALFNFKWFSIHSFIFIICCIYIILRKRKNSFLVSLLFMYLIFLVLYTSHFRSYYYVHFGTINPFDALRYLNNFFIISSITISYILCDTLNNKKLLMTSTPIFIGLLMISLYYTRLNREEFSEIEKENRFNNPTSVLKYLSAETDQPSIITDDILIFQLLGDKDLKIIDLNSIKTEDLNSYSNYLFLSNQNKDSTYKYRHPNTYDIIKSLNLIEIKRFKNNDSLYKIDLNNETLTMAHRQ